MNYPRPQCLAENSVSVPNNGCDLMINYLFDKNNDHFNQLLWFIIYHMFNTIMQIV